MTQANDGLFAFLEQVLVWLESTWACEKEKSTSLCSAVIAHTCTVLPIVLLRVGGTVAGYNSNPTAVLFQQYTQGYLTVT